MRIPQESQSAARYNQLKSDLKKAAQNPKAKELITQTGDRFEVTQDFALNSDGGRLIIKAGTAFDDDIKTRDTITVESRNGNSVARDSFENYSERKGWPFKRDQEFLKVTYSDQSLGGFSTNSTTFEL